jgi:hypothetical protein
MSQVLRASATRRGGAEDARTRAEGGKNRAIKTQAPVLPLIPTG